MRNVPVVFGGLVVMFVVKSKVLEDTLRFEMEADVVHLTRSRLS